MNSNVIHQMIDYSQFINIASLSTEIKIKLIKELHNLTSKQQFNQSISSSFNSMLITQSKLFHTNGLFI